MTAYVIGVDPGKDGAIALAGSDGSLHLWDMPVHLITVGTGRRKRVDFISLRNLLDPLTSFADLGLMEQVGGRPKQSAGAAFVFGWSAAVAWACLIYGSVPVDTVTAVQWKRHHKVRGKAGKGSEGAIMKRADEIFPQHRQLFRGPKGGLLVDRAEAAMIARFGLEVILPARGSSS